MRILICNERFLFRFGVDRSLIILGRGLKEKGHVVSVMANKMDDEVIDTFADQKIIVPAYDGQDYFYSNEFIAEWLEARWNELFTPQTSPDVIIVGGWPFFAAIPFLMSKSKVIFLDCGAVPMEGMIGGTLEIQQKVRSMRKQYLPSVAGIVSISDFIANSQSKIDSQNKVPVETILLGADHMEMAVWSKSTFSKPNEIYRKINELKDRGEKIILNLGRWEPDNYKNSQVAYKIFEKIVEHSPKSTLLILADENSLEIPHKLKARVLPVGFPDDTTLLEIMKKTDLGLSVSLWEGFNLPLAEMQHFEIPTLVFNIGAHPEVVFHPWYLCQDEPDMSSKALKILDGVHVLGDEEKLSYRRFHEYFQWERFMENWESILFKLFAEDMQLFIHVNNSSQDVANSGVVRVCRRVSRALQEYLDPHFVIWDHETGEYIFPTQVEYRLLSQYNGPEINGQAQFSYDEAHRVKAKDVFASAQQKKKWLLLPETVNPEHLKEIFQFAHNHEISVASIFYDAIPILRPDLCNDEIRQNHAKYMHELAKSDVIVPISQFAGSTLENFWEDDASGKKVVADVLPGEFAGAERVKEISTGFSNEIKILCVSTLEPRKNHRNLLDACLRMEKLHPEINWSITLVGNRYAGKPEIAEYVEMITQKNSRIKWLGIVDDLELGRLYQECTFTVYPSIIEGFGMPIMESLWHAKPCICYREGVMAELAAEGGCLTTDVLDIESLANSMIQMATDFNLYSQLSAEAVSRKIRNWNDYARDLMFILADRSPKAANQYLLSVEANLMWEDILYPECLRDHWQMNHSERLSLTALLARHKPHCSIEVGTYQGGSLSLISQFSGIVFSIDIDEEIPTKFAQFENVIFLTGPSDQILPILFDELDQAGIAVDFILIDGDHSEQGIKKDVARILEYTPQKPMFVVMHDSFNPSCRKGMLEAGWEKSPYVDWVDLDFVPGRLVEHGGGSDGELWGGLGLVYLKPIRRSKDLIIHQSAVKMHTMVKEIVSSKHSVGRK